MFLIFAHHTMEGKLMQGGFLCGTEFVHFSHKPRCSGLSVWGLLCRTTVSAVTQPVLSHEVTADIKGSGWPGRPSNRVSQRSTKLKNAYCFRSLGFGAVCHTAITNRYRDVFISVH